MAGYAAKTAYGRCPGCGRRGLYALIGEHMTNVRCRACRRFLALETEEYRRLGHAAVVADFLGLVDAYAAKIGFESTGIDAKGYSRGPVRRDLHPTGRYAPDAEQRRRAPLLDLTPKPQGSLTQRGFGVYTFEDEYGHPCSLQESSRAAEDCVWLGRDGDPPVRMHLTRGQVKALLPLLRHFVRTGNLPQPAAT